MGINTLNNILPSMCKEAGFKRKTNHCLKVTCVSSSFNAGVEEKLIRDRTGLRSNALFKDEKIVKFSLMRFLRCWRLNAALTMKK